MRVALVIAAATLALSGSRALAAEPKCASAGVVKYRHISELPPDAVAAIGELPMSDVGGPFNATDAAIILDDGSGVTGPGERFIDAEQDGCRLVIRYEQGGIGYSHGQIILQQTANGWALQRGTWSPYARLIDAGPGAKLDDTINDTANAAAAQSSLSDEDLVAWAKRTLDVREWGKAPATPDSVTYRGRRVAVVKAALGQVDSVAFDLPRGVSCGSAGGIVERHNLGDAGLNPVDLCIPKILKDRGLDRLTGSANTAFAQAPLTDDGLVALATELLDVNNLGREPDLSGLAYRGRRLAFVRGQSGLVSTIQYDLPRNVSCKSVDGVVEKYNNGDITAHYFEACIPKVLVDHKLDHGVVVRGPKFTDESLKAFAADFFRHGEYRKRLPENVQRWVVGTYRAQLVETSIACDIVGSVEPQCLQADAPLVVSLGGGGADCQPADGVRVRFEVPNEYKVFRGEACIPKILMDSGLWKQGLAPGAKAEVLAAADKDHR